MPPSLPIELIQQILEHVVNILFTENHATCDTFSAVGPPVDFLRGAAVVHSTWLPIVKDLYLRHAPITGGNYEAYLSLLQARGTEFISSIRFLRVVGMWWLDKATGEACWNVILAHSQEATEILSKLVGALPELREVELVRWIVNDLRWAAEHPHIARVGFSGAGVVPSRDVGSASAPCIIPSLSFEQLVECSDPVDMHDSLTLLTLHSTYGMGALVMEDGAREEGQLAEIFCQPGHTLYSLNTVRHLYIGSRWTGRMTEFNDFYWWSQFKTLEHLVAPLGLLSGSDDPSNLSYLPLPPTLRTLSINASPPSTRHDPFLTLLPRSDLEKPNAIAQLHLPPFAGHSPTDARSLVLCAVQDLEHLERLTLSELLLSEELVEECKGRKIELVLWE